MSNQAAITTTRSPRLSAKQIAAAKAAAELAPASVAKITSRFVDIVDLHEFDKALKLIQQDQADGIGSDAYAVRLKIEDQVAEAREAAKVVVQPKTKPAAKTTGSDRVAKAVELRQAGWTLQAIADELGYASRQSARGVIVRAMEVADA
jgi:hypothetical protein